MKTLYGLIVALSTVVALVLTGSGANAASSSVGKNNFYGTCDAQAHVSDATTSGKVEVFGGWGCQVNKYFTGTLVCAIWVNGSEKFRTTKDILLASSRDCAVTYPDYSSSDSYVGKVIIKGQGGTNFTLTTGAIRT
ncbi:hypothetical protein [Cryptosporangium aurantiacum]|uniref:Uncharacterized protein n=1 Tax=Cryptosporangium aurantiacum TaxID=134849 RepID=A0A1M7RLK8_9ACTN|nr:hypothetical protein [Cryptosporangium aurantiacum]SHN47205.1 hypothetical protein SAMN05443668_12153 [Cryptosporangium aurantiacum]